MKPSVSDHLLCLHSQYLKQQQRVHAVQAVKNVLLNYLNLVCSLIHKLKDRDA